MKRKLSLLPMLIVLSLATSIFLFGGCVAQQTEKKVVYQNTVEKTIESYAEAGKWWGSKHWNETPRIQPGEIDTKFVDALIDRNNLDFFWTHSDLKEAFKKGYRMGYEDRTADLILGPHIEKAAITMGNNISNEFVEVINTFEKDWIVTLRKAIDVFIVLIAEGSQADREGFIREFTQTYSKKYNVTQSLLKSGGFMAQTSEGGTLLHIDMTKVKAVLDIPSPDSLKTEIYHQTFKVMGDEMGRRYSHNLIERNNLVEWLRRSRTALQEVLGNNLGIIYCAFIDSYGTDATNVFQELIKEAGYKEGIRSADCNYQKKLSKFQSNQTTTVKSNYSTVNIRPTPSKENKAIAILSGGTEVEIIVREGNWIKIQFIENGVPKSGWIYETLLN